MLTITSINGNFWLSVLSTVLALLVVQSAGLAVIGPMQSFRNIHPISQISPPPRGRSQIRNYLRGAARRTRPAREGCGPHRPGQISTLRSGPGFLSQMTWTTFPRSRVCLILQCFSSIVSAQESYNIIDGLLSKTCPACTALWSDPIEGALCLHLPVFL